MSLLDKESTILFLSFGIFIVVNSPKKEIKHVANVHFASWQCTFPDSMSGKVTFGYRNKR
jgi:hypothetical protein